MVEFAAKVKEMKTYGELQAFIEEEKRFQLQQLEKQFAQHTDHYEKAIMSLIRNAETYISLGSFTNPYADYLKAKLQSLGYHVKVSEADKINSLDAKEYYVFVYREPISS